MRSATLAWILLAARALPAADAPREPPLPRTPPGWKLEVVAEAPAIAHPSVVAVAPDGRVFVAEDPMDISAPADKPSDRILCLHPGGRITVFAEKLYAVFGMQYLEGKLYVLHNPKFSVFTDEEGVGRGREDLIECTNPNPWALDWNDHIPANFRLAMDGYFYIAVGDKGIYGAVGRDGKRVDMKGGGILRMRPDATALEIYATGTRNHPDLALNAEDEIFTYDNTDEKNAWWTRVTHMVDGGYYGFPWDYQPRRPYTLWMMADYGGGAPAGALAYEEDALPPEYHGNLFLSEWGRRELLRLRVERDGATYKIASSENFLPDAPADFRPVGIAVAADGMGFYIADWNHRDTKDDVRVGRLLRLSFTGESRAAPRPAWYAPAAMGRPFEASTSELAAGLSHPAWSVRLTAQRRLAGRGAESIAALRTVLEDRALPERARRHALWGLDAIDGGAAARRSIIALLDIALLDDPSPGLRLQAIRQLGTRRVREALPALITLLRDPSAAVRYRASTALGRIGYAEAVPGLLQALDEEDLFARHAAFRALQRIGLAKAGAWTAIARGLESPSPAIREGTLFALRETYDPAAVEALARAAAEPGIPPATRADALGILSSLHRKEPEWKGEWWAYFPLSSGPPRRTVEWSGTPLVRAALLRALRDPETLVRRAAAHALRDVVDPGATEEIAEAFPAERDPGARGNLLAALSAAGHPRAAEAVSEILDDPASDPALALEAIRDAARRKDSPRLIRFLAGEPRSTAVLSSAAEALGACRPADAVPVLAKLLEDEAPPVRASAVQALSSIGGDAAAEKALGLLGHSRGDVRRSAIQVLGNIRSRSSLPALLAAFRHENEETRLEAAGALARIPDPGALDAYIHGLGTRSPALREACRAAIKAIRREVLPELEVRLAAGTLGPRVVGELQRLYSEAEPIRSWSVLGPFSPASAPAPGDLLDGGDGADGGGTTLEAPGGGRRTWKPMAAGENGLVNLHVDFLEASGGDAAPAVAYARAVILSPEERDADILAGSDDTIAIWLDGKKVHENLTTRTWKAAEDRVRARFRAGENSVLVRSGQEGGGWGFSVHVTPPRRGPLFEARGESAEPEEYLEFALANPGDPERGRALFGDLSGVACARCHGSGSGAESRPGPDLSGIGAQYDRRQLAESILHPSKVVREGYRQLALVLRDGRVITGLPRGESGGEVIVLDADAKEHRLRADEIEHRETTDLSMMPEGLHAALSLEDFADIIAFLEASRVR